LKIVWIIHDCSCQFTMNNVSVHENHDRFVQIIVFKVSLVHTFSWSLSLASVLFWWIWNVARHSLYEVNASLILIISIVFNIWVVWITYLQWKYTYDWLIVSGEIISASHDSESHVLIMMTLYTWKCKWSTYLLDCSSVRALPTNR
jgi:hypothetical protein